MSSSPSSSSNPSSTQGPATAASAVAAAVGVYCGSSSGTHPAYLAAARSLGTALARTSRPLIYGPGPGSEATGLMRAVAGAARESGGRVVGVVPRPMVAATSSGGEGDEEDGKTSAMLSSVDQDKGRDQDEGRDIEEGKESKESNLKERKKRVEIIQVDSMHERKLEIARRVGGFVALPGGFGTFEEVMEAITWTQIGLHDKPVIILNVLNFYAPLRALIKASVQAGFISPESERLAVFVDPAPNFDSSSSNMGSSCSKADYCGKESGKCCGKESGKCCGKELGEGGEEREEREKEAAEFDWGRAALEALDGWERGLVERLYDWPDRMDHGEDLSLRS